MKLKTGLIGTGTVGQGVLDLISTQGVFFKRAFGIDIEISAICAKTEEELSQIAWQGAIKTTHAEDICSHPEIQVVIELAGGYDLPRRWISSALKNRKHIVTANKALLAKYGHELFPLAKENGCHLLFEAAVGGGIPIIRGLRESLVANDILELACIINGTCNFILTEMSEKSIDFKTALQEAQALGFAEADPSFDVQGTDSAHKVALLASLCYGKYAAFEEMAVEGISTVSGLDVQTARELGFVIKLLGIVKNHPDGRVSAHVYPALVKKEHQLAAVNGVLNAVFIRNSSAGEILMTGAGAGRYPTASSVVADLISIGKKMKSGCRDADVPDFIASDNRMALVPVDELETEFYLRFTTRDETGVISKITAILAEFNISINSILQKPAGHRKSVPIVIVTHKVQNKSVSGALAIINQLDFIECPAQVIRFFN